MSRTVRSLAPSLIGVIAWISLSPAPAPAQNAEGLFVTVPNPITTDALERIQKQIDPRLHGDAKQPLQTVVFDFNPDGKPAATAKPGVCSDLTAYIRRIGDRVTTVAFVHNKVSGHTVMPALACRELVMSKGGAIGEIAGEGIEPERGEYRGYFEKDTRFKDTRFALIQKMYDPEVQLRKGRGRQPPNDWLYVDARSDAEVAKVAGDVRSSRPVEGTQDGQLALYNLATAREVGLCKGSAETRKEVAERYGLARITEDVLQGRTPDAYRWTLKGDVDGAMKESVNRVIRDVRKKGGNVLILVLNCGGNDLLTARELADDLRAAQTGDEGVHIIGFIPESAPAAATVLALGCTDIVMTKPKADTPDAKEAEIGDFEGYIKSAKPGEVDANLASIRDLAETQGYPGILIDGMFKKDIVIVRVTGKTDKRLRRLMTIEEFEKNKADWNNDGEMKSRGQLLKLSATRAVELGLARYTVEGTDVKDVTAIYGYKDAKDPDPGWLDKFAEFLRLPVVTVLLVVIGFTGLILELKVPGLTVPGIIAALCFILVFWAQSRFSGQTFVLALLLFLLGLVLVGLEIFVLPGFGACGISGILCMLAGLGLVTLDRIPQTGAEWGNLGVRVSQYLFAMMGAMGLAFLIAKYLPKVPYANRMILKAPSDKPETAADVLPGAGEAAELLGAIGTTNTALRPAGVVKFGDKFVDVVSDGGYIPAGTRVQVIQVEGTRIVVKEV
jgi:membrane-bound serine protease (ClpP class)